MSPAFIQDQFGAMPDNAPPVVAAADAKYRDLVERLHKVEGQLKDAEHAVGEALSADVTAAADAYADGREPENDGKRERKAREHLAQCERTHAGPRPGGIPGAI
jgi:hypothetical protein